MMALRPWKIRHGWAWVASAILALPQFSLATIISTGSSSPGSATSGTNTPPGRAGPNDGRPNHSWKKGGYPNQDEYEGTWRRARDRQSHWHRHHREGTGSYADATSGAGKQGGYFSGTGTGYRTVAGGLSQSAGDLRSQVAQITQAQQSLASYSYRQYPGPTNTDARAFYDANKGGQSRIASFQASDPVVAEQAEHYDELGRTANELEREAEKYELQAQEMGKMADATEKRAENIETVNAPSATAANTAPVSAENLRPNGHVASDPPAKLGSNALAQRNSEEQFARPAGVSAPGSASNISTPSTSSYPARAGDTSNGRASRSSLREELRARFNESHGRAPSEKELAALSREAEGKSARDQAAALKGEAKAGAGAAAGTSDDTVAGFSKGLGDPRLEIAGSETDASVRAMMRELGTAEDARSRGPASTQGSEIGSEDGPSLFERAHATHRRCQKNGCVSQHASAGKAGG